MQKVIITKEGPDKGRIGLAEVCPEGVAVYINFNPKPVLMGFNEFKVIDKTTVKDATLLAFNKQREFFSILDLVREVRAITVREYLMDGTILRRLRELREDGRINYEVFDSVHCKYKKI